MAPRRSASVAIAGGGIVGRTLAVALASQSHINVRLYAGPQPERDERASAVAAAARRLFSRLGVWPQLSGAAEPIREMIITDSADGDVIRPEVLSFEGERGESAFAHMVPNGTLRTALGARLEALGVRETPDSVTFYEEGARGLTVETDAGASDGADILIAADGRFSRLRSIAGIDTVEREYGQCGITGTVDHELPHHGRAVQHFLPNGPLAMLPLQGERSSLVWTERPGFGARMESTDPMLASLEVERVFGTMFGRLCIEGPLQVYPLVGMLARRWHAGRLALVGDAAHVIHPLAGQGLNLGLRDVAALAETLIEAHRNGEDLVNALARYERWRRADTTMMALVTGGLNAIFSRRSDLLRSVRGVGLHMVERRDDLKALFMREAAGEDGELPRLMRGEAI